VKILFLDQFSDMGGAQHSLLDSVDAARGLGWETIAAIPGKGPLPALLRSRGVPVIDIPCGPYRSTSKSVADVFRFLSDLRRQIRIIKALANGLDLLYVNGPRLLPAAALASGKAPILYHAHIPIQQALVRKLATWSVRHADATVIACSRFVLEPFRAYAAREQVHVIVNGVHEIPFRLRAFGETSNWRIGMVGRISPEKGQADFLRAAKLLQPEFPNVRFLVCGAPLFADPKYYAEIQDLASGLPVEFVGWLDNVGSIFGKLDMLVVPSQAEPQGRVILEAFAAGVPVVAFATGGIPEVVTDGATGFLTAETSPQALAQAIRSIIRSDPATLRRVTTNARAAWEQFYSADIYKARISELLQSLAPTSQEGHETEAPLPRR
jgi:glycosyltransferase involved in cell wall biosynthesis